MLSRDLECGFSSSDKCGVMFDATGSNGGTSDEGHLE